MSFSYLNLLHLYILLFPKSSKDNVSFFFPIALSFSLAEMAKVTLMGVMVYSYNPSIMKDELS